MGITSSLETNKGLFNLEKCKNLKVDVKVNLNDCEDLSLLGNLGEKNLGFARNNLAMSNSVYGFRSYCVEYLNSTSCDTS